MSKPRKRAAHKAISQEADGEVYRAEFLTLMFEIASVYASRSNRSISHADFLKTNITHSAMGRGAFDAFCVTANLVAYAAANGIVFND